MVDVANMTMSVPPHKLKNESFLNVSNDPSLCSYKIRILSMQFSDISPLPIRAAQRRQSLRKDTHLSLGPKKSPRSVDFSSSANIMEKINRRDKTLKDISSFSCQVSRSALPPFQYMNSIMNTMRDGLIVINKQGIISSINASGLKIFSYEEDEVIGKNVNILMNNIDAGRHDKYLRDHAKGEGAGMIGGEPREVDGQTSYGDLVRLELTVNQVTDSGEVYYVGIFRDISERIKRQQILIDAKDKAQAAVKEKTEFLSNMNHELRTPLNAILGFSSVIESELFGPLGASKYKEYAVDIFSSGKHLLNLIDNILDISAMDLGDDNLNESIIDIVPAVEDVIKAMAETANANDLSLRADLATYLPPMSGDSKKLDVILTNLVSNAIKFTLKGGEILIRCWFNEGSGYVIQVIDTGIGISYEDIPRIMEPFQYVENTFSKTQEGTGIGLTLAKSLVEIHEGSLSIQSCLGEGTTVTLRFPKSRVEEIT